MTEPAFAPRNVKPRTRTYKALPVVAIQGKRTLNETLRSGDTSTIVDDLPAFKPTLFAMQGSADFLSRLNERYSVSHPDTWQFRVSSHERGIVQPDGTKVASRVSLVIHFFGFKGKAYHKLIDPVTMYGQRLDDIWPPTGTDAYSHDHLPRLLQWAVQLRDFCDENQIEVRPTIGGIGAQFLTDRRFYSKPRRKTPAKINQRAREELPGNHYALAVHPTPHQEFTAWYLDQHRAHHYHARAAQLPDANSLYAYGMFANLDDVRGIEYLWSEVPTDFKGLLCLDLNKPQYPRPFDWISHRTKAWKEGRVFVFTNELQHVLDMGYTINGIRAAWGSFQQDAGLPRYATWAEAQIDRYGSQPWIKPILLATYGTLATKASHGETIWRLAKRGQPVEVLTGHKTLPGILTKRAIKLEPGIANVIHRGMIEAGCRSESVGLAQWLTAQDFTVLSIYADAVIVRQEDQPLPDLIQHIEPWRLKATLNHLQFINKQAFISGEMTKLPGVGREALAYRSKWSPGISPVKPQYEAISGQRVR